MGVALGAVLYTPALRIGIARDILTDRWPGLAALVLCLEDAIGAGEVAVAERILIQELGQLQRAVDNDRRAADQLPLLFVRVRDPAHLTRLTRRLGDLGTLLTGFVFPKFGPQNALGYLNALTDASVEFGIDWLGMPILEGAEIMYAETRAAALVRVADVLEDFRHRIPCVRIGGTDLSGLYGLRRSPDTTIYDLAVVRDCIADIVNVFGRPQRGFVLSGPVWEYLNSDRRLLKPQLRESPFTEGYGARGRELRHQLITSTVDGLVREAVLDQANGLQGKTVIHPSHIVPVNALSAVSWDEFQDAEDLLSDAGRSGGARRSMSGLRMNESAPHRRWAERLVLRARYFGVLKSEHSSVSLLDACVPALRDALNAA